MKKILLIACALLANSINAIGAVNSSDFTLTRENDPLYQYSEEISNQDAAKDMIAYIRNRGVEVDEIRQITPKSCLAMTLSDISGRIKNNFFRLLANVQSGNYNERALFSALEKYMKFNPELKDKLFPNLKETSKTIPQLGSVLVCAAATSCSKNAKDSAKVSVIETKGTSYYNSSTIKLGVYSGFDKLKVLGIKCPLKYIYNQDQDKNSSMQQLASGVTSHEFGHLIFHAVMNRKHDKVTVNGDSISNNENNLNIATKLFFDGEFNIEKLKETKEYLTTLELEDIKKLFGEIAKDIEKVINEDIVDLKIANAKNAKNCKKIFKHKDSREFLETLRDKLLAILNEYEINEDITLKWAKKLIPLIKADTTDLNLKKMILANISEIFQMHGVYFQQYQDGKTIMFVNHLSDFCILIANGFNTRLAHDGLVPLPIDNLSQEEKDSEKFKQLVEFKEKEAEYSPTVNTEFFDLLSKVFRLTPLRERNNQTTVTETTELTVKPTKNRSSQRKRKSMKRSRLEKRSRKLQQQS